jgi:hypothetical protein
MFKFKTIAIAALVALIAVAFFALRAPAGSNAPSVIQIDAVDLMSKAGDLPVQPVPAP